MNESTQRVLDESLKLNPVERAELIEQILSSFEFPDREEVDAAWAKEAEERVDAYERGETGSTPADEVYEQINKRRSS
jgi:putative addiction module component (TIGR02574 family)